MKIMPNGGPSALTGGDNNVQVLAVAKDTALTTVQTDVLKGSIIKAIHLKVDIVGTSADDISNVVSIALFKNPGNNLTLPGGNAIGTSNEKKFCFYFTRGLAMGNANNRNPIVNKWIKVPKVYQRMGTDDQFQLILHMIAGPAATFCWDAIIKYYY